MAKKEAKKVLCEADSKTYGDLYMKLEANTRKFGTCLQ